MKAAMKTDDDEEDYEEQESDEKWNLTSRKLGIASKSKMKYQIKPVFIYEIEK